MFKKIFLTAAAAAVLVAILSVAFARAHPKVKIEVVDSLKPAFYMAQPQDLKPNSGINFNDYGLIVANAGMDPNAIKNLAPDAIILAYVSPKWVAYWGIGNPVHDAYRAMFTEENFWHNADGERICSTWEKGGPADSTGAYPTTHELLYSADTAVKFVWWVHRYFQPSFGWDGIYIDDCGSNLAPCYFRDGGCHGTRCEPLPINEFGAQMFWDYYRNMIFSLLRGLSYEGLIIVNMGPYRNDDVIELLPDGICSEEWWPDNQETWLDIASRFDPRYCVTWEWSSPDSIARDGEHRYRVHW